MSHIREDLPPVLVTAVRSGFDAFVQLQRIRFSKCFDVPFFTERSIAVSDAAAPYPTTLCEWSDLLLSRLKAVGESTVVDPTAEVVWELVSTVLAILEGGGDSAVNASAPYLEWYRGRFVCERAIHDARDALRAAPHWPNGPAPAAEFLDNMLGPYMATVQRCFLAGLFPHTAELVSALADYLRGHHHSHSHSHSRGGGGGGGLFDAEEESALADVVRLLAAPPATDAQHCEWAAAANALIVDAKRVLEARDIAGSAGPAALAGQQLKALCLDLLLMMSGDVVLIHQMCDLLDLDAADYVAAVCAVCEPCLTLRQLHDLYRNAWLTWGSARGPWYGGVLELVLSCRCAADMVAAMARVGEAVRRDECAAGAGSDEKDIVCTPARSRDLDRHRHRHIHMRRRSSEDGEDEDEYTDDNVHGDDDDDDDTGFGEEDYYFDDENLRGDSGSTDENENEDEDEDANDNSDNTNGAWEGEGEPNHPLLRRFALLFMAAHVSDICAPPLGAPADQISVTFARNELIGDYMALFQHHPLLWRTAATYALCSPFMNPAVLRDIIARRAVSASLDRHTFLALHSFVHSAWDESCAFQSALLSLLRAKYPKSLSLRRWADAAAHCRRRAVAALHDGIVRSRLARGETAAAVWLAVECQRSTAIQLRLERLLRAPGALESAEVRRVGDAVTHAFVAVDASANLRMLNALRLCAALADLARAAAAGLAQEDFLRAAERALQCAVPFRAHASTILAIVEDAADAALPLPVARRPPQLIPLLTNALEVSLLNCNREDAEKMAPRAAYIREKMMQLL